MGLPKALRAAVNRARNFWCRNQFCGSDSRHNLITFMRGALAALVLFSCLALPSPTKASETITYSYDALGRLVTVARSGTVNNGVSSSYTYDQADNRTNVTVTTGGI